MKLVLKIFLIALPFVLLAEEVTVEQLFSVQTVKVKKETISQSSKHYGFVKTDESRKYNITPRFGGYVVNIYADKIYKHVKKGDPLLTVYSPEVLKAKDEYLNTLSYAKKHTNNGMLKNAKLKLQLLGISDKEINDVKKENISSIHTTIYSPVDGYVFMKNVSKGSAFNAKQILFEIVDLDKVWVEVQLMQEQRAKLSSVKNYKLTFNGLEKTYTTDKKYLYPQLDPKIATLTLRLSLDNYNHDLFPGMYATVMSQINEQEYLILPVTAVIRKDAKHYVFITGEYEGEYEPIEVKVSALNHQSYTIISGLNEGDIVVNNALFMMDSDAQINSLY